MAGEGAAKGKLMAAICGPRSTIKSSLLGFLNIALNHRRPYVPLCPVDPDKEGGQAKRRIAAHSLREEQQEQESLSRTIREPGIHVSSPVLSCAGSRMTAIVRHFLAWSVSAAWFCLDFGV